MQDETPTGLPHFIRLAGIQFAAQDDRDRNIKRALSFTQKALEKNAQIIVFPECFTLPWFHQIPKDTYHKLAEPVPGPSTEPFLKLSMEYPSTFFCPIYHQQNKHFYFSTVCIQEGQILGIYRKVHLASAEGWNDRLLADPGQDIPLFKTKQATIGVSMGWDVFFPEAFRSMALRGAEIIIAPTAAALGSKFRWLSVLSGHAICNNLFLVRINRCGTEKDLTFYGESFCVDPFGSLIDEPTFHRDSLMVVDINLADIDESRKEFPFLKEMRTDLYNLPVTQEFKKEKENEI